MVRSTWVLGLALLAVAVMPNAADAQNPQTRQGFFIGFGLGVGSLGVEDGDERETSGAGHLTIGGTLNPQVLLAGEATGWTKEEDGGRLTHSNISAIVQFYPMVESGLWLRAGVGGSTWRVSAEEGNVTVSIDETGLGFTGGLGYDIRVGSNFSITPYGLFVWGDFDLVGSVSHFQGGLGVTFH